MAAPPKKPWERPGVNCNNLNYPRNSISSSSTNQFINDVSMQVPGSSGLVGSAGGSVINPPPLPPRPVIQQGYGVGSSPYGYGSTFNSGYSYSPYSSMYSSPYSMSYGGGYGMNRFGYSPYAAASQNGFVQMAEESSRPAFQSVESIVHAVGSVSMMLESTYNALYSSFRAVLGVAHHFGQMKTQITQILSALAVIRSLKWLYRKVLYMIGINKINPLNDDIWSSVTKSLNESNLPDTDGRRKKSNWPIIVFLAVVFGGPWLIWKFLMSIYSANEEGNKQWMTGEGPHYLAVAMHHFRAEQPNELSFAARQVMRIAPKELQPKVRGWLLASLDGKTTGLIPANYIKIRSSPNPPKQAAAAQPTPNEADQSVPLLNEDAHLERESTLPLNKTEPEVVSLEEASLE